MKCESEVGLLKNTFALVLSLAMLCAAFAGCSQTQGEPNPAVPTINENALPTTDASVAASTSAETAVLETHTDAPSNAKTEASKPPSNTKMTTTSVPVSRTRPAIAMSREAEKDGLVLRVQAAYAHQWAGEAFAVTAAITNTTKEDIHYTLPSGTPGMHLEIRVTIRGKNNIEFIDMDTYGKAMTEDMKIAVLKPGETFTETIRFQPGSASGDDWYPAGEYEGTATFTWIVGAMDYPQETQQLSLEFPVILV